MVQLLRYSGGSRYLAGFNSKLGGGGLGNEGGVGLGNGTTLACDTQGEQTFDWVGFLVVGLRNGTTLDGNTWGEEIFDRVGVLVVVGPSG